MLFLARRAEGLPSARPVAYRERGRGENVIVCMCVRVCDYKWQGGTENGPLGPEVTSQNIVLVV